MNLKDLAVSGIWWTFMDTIMARGVGILTGIFLARMLSPVEFGLMGMIYIFTSISSTLVESGMNSSLVRDNQANSLDFSTVFFTNIGISTFLYLVLFFTAPLIAEFYDQVLLTSIIRVYSLIFVINSFSAVQRSLLVKKLAFKQLMKLNIPGIVVGSAVGIILAFNDFGVWSIIFMQLTTQGVLSIMLWIFNSWKPKLDYSVMKLKKHWSFGYKLMIAELIGALFDNVYNVLIGKFFAVKTLGQFERAKTFNNYPVIVLTTTISKVTYPLMSQIREDNKKLKNVYRQIVQFAFFVSVPVMLTLSVVSEPLFVLVLGPQWQQASHFFGILCFAGILYPIHSFNLNLLKVYGRSDWLLKVEIFKKIVIIAMILIAFQFGIYGLVWSAVASSFAALLINTYYTNKLISYTFLNQLIDLSSILLFGIITYILMYFVLIQLKSQEMIWQILIPSISGLISYFLMAYITKNPTLNLMIKTKLNSK